MVVRHAFPCRSPHGERGLKFKPMRDNKGSDGCRSPHGERGLKLIVPPCLTCAARVALLMESVD